MERVQVLIEKLSTQKAANESVAQLLLTVQLLHQELVSLQPTATLPASKKVAVVLPTMVTAPIYSHQDVGKEKTVINKVEQVVALPVETKEEKPLFQQQSFFTSEPEVVKPEPAREESISEAYTLRKPIPVQQEVVKEEPKITWQPSTPLPFDVIEETPTLSQHQPQREIHEVLGSKEASLNDKLKQEKIELVTSLKEAPIKDLRKAIGVNDKFSFISELFRGDEGMYERSIKTINAFNILPEAEYWINRELKMKLMWNDNSPSVQHFYQLVKRRFS